MLTEADQAFLANYDARMFERPSVTVDTVILTFIDTQLHVLLYPRTEAPYAGMLALPGGFVGIQESLEAAVERVLLRKVGIKDLPTEQLQAFGHPDRDPRWRVISIAFLALVPMARLGGHPSWPIQAVTGKLAFDHGSILAFALQRLREQVEHWAPRLLPEHFSLKQLQNAHEAILGTTLNKDAFRRRILATGQYQATGVQQTDVGHRPAQLYHFYRSQHG